MRPDPSSLRTWLALLATFAGMAAAVPALSGCERTIGDEDDGVQEQLDEDMDAAPGGPDDDEMEREFREMDREDELAERASEESL